MKYRIKLKAALLTILFFLAPTGTLMTVSSGVQAGDFSDMSCSDLWYERNAIYADKGYCFKTERARRAFGRACFPPYGRLSQHEQRQVERIKRLEARMGCR